MWQHAHRQATPSVMVACVSFGKQAEQRSSQTEIVQVLGILMKIWCLILLIFYLKLRFPRRLASIPPDWQLILKWNRKLQWLLLQLLMICLEATPILRLYAIICSLDRNIRIILKKWSVMSWIWSRGGLMLTRKWTLGLNKSGKFLHQLRDSQLLR
jgi:hypothetical protein